MTWIVQIAFSAAVFTLFKNAISRSFASGWFAGAIAMAGVHLISEFMK